MPDLFNVNNLPLCVGGGVLFLLVFVFIRGRPKESYWMEKCPYCNAELGPKFKGEKLTTCRKCKHDLYTSKPHSS